MSASQAAFASRQTQDETVFLAPLVPLRTVCMDEPKQPSDAHLDDTSRETPLLSQAICDQREPLMQFALRLCRNRPLAEDLVQETLARALEKAHTLHKQDRLAYWAKTILINIYRDQIRRYEQPMGLTFEPPGHTECPADLLERSEFGSRLQGAIQQLSPKLRHVVGLICIADLSYADTAKVLDVPVGTVMSRLWRARQNLRPLLDQQ